MGTDTAVVEGASLVLWRRLVDSAAWDLVVSIGVGGEAPIGVAMPPGARVVALDPDRTATTTIDGAIGLLGQRRACIRIDVDRVDDVLAGGRHALARMADLLIQARIPECAPEQVLAWTDRWRVYLHDLQTGALLRVDGGQPDRVAALLARPWISSHDAVLRRVS